MENSRLVQAIRIFTVRAAVVFCMFICLLSGFSPVRVFAGINDTKHNLSVTGPGPFKSLTESRICVFCHTPHNATPDTPLWNHKMSSQTYNLYTSDTLLLAPSQPTGPTKLCLSCHDGTVALGSVVNPLPGPSGLDSPIPAGNLSSFGFDLAGHHPVVFSYPQAQQLDITGQLVDVSLLPLSVILGGTGNVHCTTCHNAHDNTYGKFLVMDNRYSALCTSCHQLNGWYLSSHATSVFSVDGILPRSPKTFPAWSQMKEWGCEVCHTPHFAATAQKLLNFCSSPVPAPYTAPFDCTTGGCHGSASPPYHTAVLSASSAKVPASSFSTSASADIKRQTSKKSAHYEQPGTGMLSRHQSKKSSYSALGSSSCVDCHNPHVINKQKASAPYVSGMLKDVSGVDANGLDVNAAQYEYEICFKCHSDYSSDVQYVPRVVNTLNKRRAFAQTNPSYHPVIAMGKERNVPSIPSTFEPTLTNAGIIYCTDCHRDDEGGSRGPHGSEFVPILRERYETADNTPENYQNYALCYRCHSRESILRDDSFGKNFLGKGGHSGHLAVGAPCSACHDPHGINDTGQSGSHTHLINFDTRIVLPATGNPWPVFMDRGMFSGSCSLICHGKVHDNESYPQGGSPSMNRFLPIPVNRMGR